MANKEKTVHPLPPPDKRERKIYRRDQFFTDNFPFNIIHVLHPRFLFNESHYHQREFWKIIYVVAGTGEKIINENRYSVRPGSIMLIHPNAKTTISIKSKGLEIYNLVFMPRFIEHELSALKADFEFFTIFNHDEPKHQELYILNSDRRFKSTVKEIEFEYKRRQPNYRAMIQMLLARLLILMARKGSKKSKPHSDTNIVSYIDHIIASHYSDNINLDMLSKKIGIGKSRICLIYRRAKGLTIMHALRNHRLHEAGRMLLESDIGIAEICYQTGFNDLSYYYRSFAQEFGVTPAEYRKRHHNE